MKDYITAATGGQQRHLVVEVDPDSETLILEGSDAKDVSEWETVIRDQLKVTDTCEL